MKRGWLVFVILMVIPLVVPAEVIHVGIDVPTVEIAVELAKDGDTLLLPQTASTQYVDLDGKNIEVGYDDIEPPGAPIDSTIYGTNNPFPASPLEN